MPWATSRDTQQAARSRCVFFKHFDSLGNAVKNHWILEHFVLQTKILKLTLKLQAESLEFVFYDPLEIRRS